jgi:hypothetical protein
MNRQSGKFIWQDDDLTLVQDDKAKAKPEGKKKFDPKDPKLTASRLATDGSPKAE